MALFLQTASTQKAQQKLEAQQLAAMQRVGTSRRLQLQEKVLQQLSAAQQFSSQQSQQQQQQQQVQNQQKGGDASMVLGVLKSLSGSLGREGLELERGEEQARTAFERMMANKGKSQNSYRTQLETKTGLLAEKHQIVVESGDAIKRKEKAVEVGEKRLKDLQADLQAQTTEATEMRQDKERELQGLNEAIKVLKSAKVQESFKSPPIRGGAATFVQVAATRQTKTVIMTTYSF